MRGGAPRLLRAPGVVERAQLGPEVDAVRKELRSLVLRGQNRIHMAKESDSRRKAIIDTVIAAGVTATVYDAGRRYGDDHASRAACLRAIVDDMGTGQPTLLVLEQDDTLVRWDRQQLVELLGPQLRQHVVGGGLAALGAADADGEVVDDRGVAVVEIRDVDDRGVAIHIPPGRISVQDRKSTRLNSSHQI